MRSDLALTQALSHTLNYGFFLQLNWQTYQHRYPLQRRHEAARGATTTPGTATTTWRYRHTWRYSAALVQRPP